MTRRRIGVAVTLGTLGLATSGLIVLASALVAHAEPRQCTEGQTRFVADAPSALSRLGARQS